MDHDDFGNVVEIIDRNNRRRTFVYDTNRRLVSERWHGGGGAVIREFTLAYSPLRGLERIDDTDPVANRTHTIEYTGRLPRPDRVTYSFHGQSSFNVRYTWTSGGDQLPAPGLIALYRGNTFQGQLVSTYHARRLVESEFSYPGGAGNAVEFRYRPDGTVDNIARRTEIGRASCRERV